METFDYQSGLWQPADSFEGVLVGLVSRVEEKTSKTGKPYTQFNLKVRYKVSPTENANDYWTVRAFGRTGQQAAYLNDGEKVLVVGGLDRRERDPQAGTWWLSCMAHEIGRCLDQPDFDRKSDQPRRGGGPQQVQYAHDLLEPF